METRNDLARPRGGFRTVQDGSLPTRVCGECGEDEYRVDAGTWLHWRNLEARCGDSAPIAVSKPRTATKSAVVGEDSPERGLARAGLSSTYRRGSWEWMGCR